MGRMLNPTCMLEGFYNAPALGPELVVNGSFATDTDWSKDTGWTIAAGKASYANVGSTAALTNTSGTAPVAGHTYRFVFTLSSYVGGGFIPTIGGTLGTSRSANGTYTQDIVAAGTGKPLIYGNSAGVGSVDDVSCKEVL